MLKHFAKIHLLVGWFPITIFGLTALGIIVLLLAQSLKSQWKLIGREVFFSLLAGASGFLAAWLVSDVFVLFEVSLGWMVIIAIATGFTALGFVISTLIYTHGWKRILSSLMIVMIVLATALRIDIIYGEYTTIGSFFSTSTYPHLPRGKTKKASMNVTEWRKLAQTGNLPPYPTEGEAFSVTINNDKSHFNARDADIYLPPAALSETPPALPVFVLLAGQPGSPDRLFTAGNIESMMNNYAAKHHGLAPIVVSPDQNGASTHNSLCVNSPVYGNAETYLTQDVPDWITSHLPVSTKADMWAIGGFSQGGTCSTQLGARHPNVYGNMLPADGELEPTQGSRKSMIQKYFHGSEQALREQEPVYAMEKNAPSQQTLFAGAGANDATSIRNMTTIGKAAIQAGMDVKLVIAQGYGHDWHAVRTCWEPALDWLGERMGLGNMSKPIQEYRTISEINIDNIDE